MAAFSYKALRADGSVTAGQVDAGGRQEAFAALERQGLRPLDLLDGAVAEGTAKSSESRPGRVSPKALEGFTRQLASLLAAGVPLSQALHLLSRESADKAGRAQWRGPWAAIRRSSRASTAPW